MLFIENISKAFGGRELFSEVNVVLQPKERYALIGRNGSGKSTLLKIIAGLEQSDAGSVRLAKGVQMGYLAQHITLHATTVLDEVLHASPESPKHEAEALLCGLGFEEKQLNESPTLFSGGYQLRIELAKTLIKKPDILLLDEPTNYLDITSIRFLERFLKRWQGSMIIISHDQSFLDSICTHTMGLYRRQLRRFQGNCENYFHKIREEEENKRRENENIRKQKAHLTKFVERFRYKASKAGQAQSKLKAIEKLGEIEDLEDETTLSFAFHEKEHPGKQILSVKNLHFSYSNETLIRDVSFDLLKGETLAIIGKNGCGKSTFLRILSKELQPKQGHLKFSMNAQSGYFGQTNVQRLLESATILEEIRQSNPKLKDQEARNIAGQMLFSGEDMFKRIEVLSGGEKARVLLGKLVAKPTNLLLLDEPSNHLDIESTEALLHALNQFEGAKVIVTHNEWVLNKLNVNKILACFEKRQVLHLGDYASFQEKFSWDETSTAQPKKKKMSKAQRAQRVQERADQLRPIRQKIAQLEREIVQLEKKKKTLEESLLILYQTDDGDRIAEATKEFHVIEKQLNSTYQLLEESLEQEEEIYQLFPDIQ